MLKKNCNTYKHFAVSGYSNLLNGLVVVMLGCSAHSVAVAYWLDVWVTLSK